VTNILVMDMNAEQRGKAAGAIIARIMRAFDAREISLEPWEVKEICGVLGGLSVTVGRLELLREIEKKYFSEEKDGPKPDSNCQSMPSSK